MNGSGEPVRVPIVSWENWPYCLSRWPLVGWGVCTAVAQKIRPRKITFMVTPKSVDGLEPLRARLILVYVIVSVVMAGAALLGEQTSRVPGYVFLCLLGAATYALVAFAICLLHTIEAARAAGVTFRRAFSVRRPARSRSRF